jgi:hypothetical protein
MLTRLAVPAPCRLPLPLPSVELPAEPTAPRKHRAPRKGKASKGKVVAVAQYDVDGVRLPSGGRRPADVVDATGTVPFPAVDLRPQRPELSGRCIGDAPPVHKVRARKARKVDGLTNAPRDGIADVRAMRDSIDATAADDVERAASWRAALLPADNAVALWEGLQGIALLSCRSEHDAAEAASILWQALAIDGKGIARPVAYVRAVARRHERRRERAAARRREHREGLAAAMFATAGADAVVIGTALADLSASTVALAVAEEGMRTADSERDYNKACQRAGRARKRLERIVNDAMANL